MMRGRGTVQDITPFISRFLMHCTPLGKNVVLTLSMTASVKSTPVMIQQRKTTNIHYPIEFELKVITQ